MTNDWKEHDFIPKGIGKKDRHKQAEWAEAAANLTRYYNSVRLFKDVLLYSQSTAIQQREHLPEPDRDYSGAPYWLMKEHTQEFIPMRSIEDIAGFFYWNTDYWGNK